MNEIYILIQIDGFYNEKLITLFKKYTRKATGLRPLRGD